jgi:hypothetical protein
MVSKLDSFKLYFEELPGKKKRGKNINNKDFVDNHIFIRPSNNFFNFLSSRPSAYRRNGRSNKVADKHRGLLSDIKIFKKRLDTDDNNSYNPKVIKNKVKDITMTKNQNKEGQPSKTNKTASTKVGGRFSGIIGVALLLGVLSIGYSTTVIVMGTNGWIPLVMVGPQAVLAVAIAAWKFSK